MHAGFYHYMKYKCPITKDGLCNVDASPAMAKNFDNNEFDPDTWWWQKKVYG